jgi:enoyl-CoA hydratase
VASPGGPGPGEAATPAAARLDWHDGLALVRLEAGRANALDARALRALRDAFAEAGARGARGIVLTGYDRFFSAGLDLVGLHDLDRTGMDGFMREFDEVTLGVFACPRPVVAAINGHAVAGGAVLALAADARLMVDGPARIGLNEVRLGLPFPAPALEIVRHAVPGPAVEPVLYGGDLFAPEVARAQGLVTGVVTGDVVAAGLELCRQLASRPAAAFAALKASVKAPAVERAGATAVALRAAFVDAWFGPEARRLVGEARRRLGA